MSERSALENGEDCTATLQRLARLLRQVRHCERRDTREKEELHRSYVNNEILSRLQHNVQAAQLQALDHARTESKKEFLDLYTTTMAHAEKVLLDIGKIQQNSTESGFLTNYPEKTKNQILDFINKLRTEPGWVAERIATLECLDTNPSFSKTSRHNISMRASIRPNGPDRAAQRPSIVDSLVFTIFAPPGACTEEDNLRLESSASIMQRLIMKAPPNSTNYWFCLATFDAWQSIYGWQSLKSFEILLMDILQSGARISEKAEERRRLNSDDHAYYFNATKRGNLEEEFFVNATRRVIKLLSSDSNGSLPQGARVLFRAISARVSDQDKSKYEFFVIGNWFFSHFLCSAIKYPEVSSLDFLARDTTDSNSDLGYLRTTISLMPKDIISFSNCRAVYFRSACLAVQSFRANIARY